MEMKLELVPVPVTDVDRAKAFYVEKLGFAEDVEHVAASNQAMHLGEVRPQDLGRGELTEDVGDLVHRPVGSLRPPSGRGTRR